ncbi:peptidase S24 [Aggregatimonas sangjinii]|uniref:Peptidase S24 n=1 Tax=Aggregatimonas sangjinii TaxID=2583587 RepID=A0A5B7SPT4_9FLAO|nr:S24 family peptidase [Aggregatimonas sangjinii]QCX00202.1 peptidase S24 [Aggregatimonas sangjinii]
MKIDLKGRLTHKSERHSAGVSQQSGFPSPATHYREPSINLHQELIGNSDATFFIRVCGHSLSEFNIMDNDVLIVDRSVPPTSNLLAVVIRDGNFEIIRIPKEGMTESMIFWGAIIYTIHRAR